MTDDETPIEFTSPLGEIIDATPRLTWTEVPAADHYVLQVDHADQPAVIDQSNLTATEFETAFPLPPGEYSARIQAIGPDDQVITESEITFTITDAPFVLSPIGSINDAIPLIEWSGIPSAAGYELRVDDVINGKPDIIHETLLTNTTFVPRHPLGSGTYRVWVRAVDDAGETGAWTNAEFQLNAAPVLDAITEPSLSATPTLTWSESPDAERYEIKLVDQSDGRVVAHETDVTDTSFMPTTPLESGGYEVWVRAHDADGPTPWSDPITFEVAAAPVVEVPTVHAGHPKPTIEWTAPTGFDAFELRIERTSTGVVRHFETNNDSTSFNVPNPLAGGDYVVQVRGILAGGHIGAWSDPTEFNVGERTHAVSVPELLGPTGAINNVRPMFSWLGVPGAHGYQISLVNLDEMEEVRSGFINGTDEVTQSYVPRRDLSAGDYVVRIRTLSRDLMPGKWSDPAPLTITGHPTGPGYAANSLDHLLAGELDLGY